MNEVNEAGSIRAGHVCALDSKSRSRVRRERAQRRKAGARRCEAGSKDFSAEKYFDPFSRMGCETRLETKIQRRLNFESRGIQVRQPV